MTFGGLFRYGPYVTNTPSASLGTRDLLVALMMNILWGLNIIAVKMGVEQLGPFTAGALRQAIVLLVCISALRIVPGRMRELVGLGILSGGIFYVFVNASVLVADNLGALAIAGQVGVPFSLLLGVVFLRERIHLARMLGVMLSFGGIVLLLFDPAIANEWLGIALTAAGSFIWAVCSLIQRRLRGVRLMTIYAWIGLGGLVVLVPAAILAEPEALRALPHQPIGALGWIAFSALGSTLLGQGAMSWLLQRHPVSSVTPLTLAAPVFSVVAASLFFATPITPLMILGGVIALAGVSIVAIRTARVRP